VFVVFYKPCIPSGYEKYWDGSMKLRKDKWMPKASKLYSNGLAWRMYDPNGVAYGACLWFFTNLVSLRDMKNIGMEV